jgi:hypothetical protein
MFSSRAFSTLTRMLAAARDKEMTVRSFVVLAAYLHNIAEN